MAGKRSSSKQERGLGDGGAELFPGEDDMSNVSAYGTN